MGGNLVVRAHHPIIEKVQSLINNKPTQKEPEEVVGSETTAEVASSPATTVPQHKCLQQDAVKPEARGTKRNDSGALADPTPSRSPDSTTPANGPEVQQESRDPVPSRVGEVLLEQVSMAPRWATAWRPPSSLGGDAEKEECCREELQNLLRDLHNYR